MWCPSEGFVVVLSTRIPPPSRRPRNLPPPVCAQQVEIDDYRDYEKAAGALREALKYLGKAGESRSAQVRPWLSRLSLSPLSLASLSRLSLSPRPFIRWRTTQVRA